MTGLIDRINRMLVRRIGPTVRQDAVAIERDIDQIRRLVAVLHEEFVGSTAVLIAEFTDGRLLRTDEHDPGWSSLLAAMDRGGSTAPSSQEWMLRLMAGPVGQPLGLIGNEI